MVALALALVACSSPVPDPWDRAEDVTAVPRASHEWDELRRPIAPIASTAGKCQFSPGRSPNHLPGARGFNTQVAADGRVSGYVAYGEAPAYLAAAETTGGFKGAVFSYSSLLRDGRAQPKVIAIIEPGHPGPLLIRGVRSDGARTVEFGRSEGPSAELRVESASGTHPIGYLQVREPGCYVIQFDTAGFSSRVTVLFDP